LQHQDGTSHLIASTIPNCISYDPAYAYELAVIVQNGMQRMLERNEDVFYYVTVTNENEAQPSMPAGAEKGILRGMYCLRPVDVPQVRLLASGPMVKEAIAASILLKEQFSLEAEVWSVTSFSELARDGIAVERTNRFQNATQPAYVTQQLKSNDAPVIAVSDYVRGVAESIRAYVPARYITLGTDGFGRSDTRANLRDFFEVDARWIVFTALSELYKDDDGSDVAAKFAERNQLDLMKPQPNRI